MTILPNQAWALADSDNIALLTEDARWLRATLSTLKTKLTDDGFLTDLGVAAEAPGVLDFTVEAADLTDGGGASGTLDAATQLPAGARVIATQVYVTGGFTENTSAVMTVGTAADPDRFNTGTPSVFAAGHVDMGAPSGTQGISTDTTVRVTVTSATDITPVIADSGAAASVRITYLKPLA